MDLTLQVRTDTWCLRSQGANIRLADASSAPAIVRVGDGSVSLFFAGVLHNRAELAGRLEMPAAASDGDVLMAAYRHWGRAVLGQIKMLGSLVICEEGGRLLAARDPLGIHSLFYAEVGDELLLAPALETLLAQPGVAANINMQTIAHRINKTPNDPQVTYYTAIRRVPPGHMLTQQDGQCTVARYWHPLPEGPVDWVRKDEIGQFEVLFDQAVERCLAQGPTGILLSGGLDSVSVAAVAADIASSRQMPTPQAFSLVMPDPDCNEEDRQRDVARALGLPQELITVAQASEGQGLITASMSRSAASPAPLTHPFVAAYHYLGRLSRQKGCAVMLTGGGGDEMLLAGPLYAADLIRQGNLPGLYHLWRSYTRSVNIPISTITHALLWKNGLRPLAHQWRARLRGQEKTQADSFYVQSMRGELDMPILSTAMEELFAFGSELGLRILHPFWDADLVAFLYRTPPELLNRGDRTKGLVRATLDRRFPQLQFGNQRKVHATNLFVRLMEEEGKAAWQRLSTRSNLVKLGVVSKQSVEEIVARSFVSPSQPGLAYQLWNILTLEAWLEPRI